MLSKSNWRGVMGVVILCIGLLFGLTSFVSADDKSKPDCVLCGHITDSTTGEAVTDATIELRGGPISKAEADANGFYCFERISKEGNYRIGIDSNEYVGIYYYDEMPGVNLKVDSPVIKDFKLDRACMIKVQVVDEANQPVGGEELSVIGVVGERSRNIGSDIRRRITDRDGFYLLGGIPPSKTSYMIIARGGDYAPAKLDVVLSDAEVTESGKIILQKGVDVNGTAQYQDGVPASDLKIYAYPDWWDGYNCPERYSIDANGGFILRHIVPGNYRLMADIPQTSGGSIGIPVSRIQLPLPDNEIIKLIIPQKSPQALASIRGKLTFVGDKTPHYVDISASSISDKYYPSIMWRNYGAGTYDANFVIDRLEPGKYKLTFSSEGIEQKVIEDVNAPCEGLLVELLPRGKTFLRGTVLNSEDNNQPIQNFKARARKMKTLRGANYQQPDKWLEVSDANGEFNIETVGPGIYQVQIAAEGFAWAWSEDVNTDQNVPVVIKLSAGGGIKGKVVNNAGKPVKGAKVLPLSMAGGVRIQATCIQDPFISEDDAVETADDGIFELKHLAPGKESIKVIHPDYAYSIVNDIEVKEGQTTEGINVVMPAGGVVEGYVYDAQGQAQPNVTLYFQDIYSGSPDEKAGRFAMVTTDANGYYRAGGLPEQLLTVKRQRGRSSSMGVVCRELVPASGKVSRIDLGGQPIISGHIIINGIPLANRRIVLSSAESPNSNAFRCYAMTGPDGKFVFGGVPNGKWEIYCEDSERRGEWIKITAAEVARQDVNLDVISVVLSTLRVSIEYESGTPKRDVIRAQLQEGNNPWDRPITKLVQPADENASYIVKNVPSGDYYLSLTRQDHVALQQPIEIPKNDVNTVIRIPDYSSGIHGRLSGRYKAGMVLWTKDKSIVGYLIPDANDNFKVNNLPAGHYYVGGNMLIDSEALLEFDLADGEQKEIDISIPDNPLKNKRTGVLQVMVLDESGSVIPGAEVRLLSGESVIEPMINSSQGIYFMAEQGAYTLQVNFPGYKAVTQQVSIERFNPKNIQALRKPVLVRLERQ